MKWTTFITWNWEKRWLWNFGSCQKTKGTNVRNQWDKESRDNLCQLKICWLCNIVATALEDMSLLIWSDWFVSGVTPLQWQWTTVMHSALSPVSQHFRHQASLTAKKWPPEVSDAVSLIIACSLKILRAIFRNPVKSYAPTVSAVTFRITWRLLSELDMERCFLEMINTMRQWNSSLISHVSVAELLGNSAIHTTVV